MNMLEGQNDLLIYKDKDGNVVVDAIYRDEILWLTQKGMAKVFGCSVDNISLHLKNIFKDKELEEFTVVEDSSITANDGKKYKTDVANTEQLLRIVQSVPSPKAEPFKAWLASVGRERIEETTGKPVITSQNAKDFRQLITDIVEDSAALPEQ